MLAAVAAIPAAVPLWPSGGGGGSPASSAPLPVLDCDITELPLPEDLPELEPAERWLTWAVAMDPTGRYILGTTTNGPIRSVAREDQGVTAVDRAGGDQVATILWDDGTPAYLPGLTEARDVNSHGVILGQDWVYRDGAVEQLAVPEGYDTVHAAAVNEAGDVVGFARVEDPGEVALGSAAVMWPGSDLADPRLLPLTGAAPAPIHVDAVDILDDGTILGHIFYESGQEGQPYLWDAGGELHQLRLPSTAIGGVVEQVRGDWVMGSVLIEVPPSDGEPVPSPSGPISSADAAAAVDDIPDYGFEPARWNLRTGTVEVIDTANSSGMISDAEISLAMRTVVAIADGDAGAEATALGVVVREATPFSLPAPDGAVGRPAAISDDGTAIAGSHATEVPVDLTEQEGTYALIPQLSSSVPVVWHC